MATNPSSPSPCSTDESVITASSREDRAKVNSLEGVGMDQMYDARAVIGKGMHKFTDLINENIIAARYGVFATVALLTVS